MERSTSALTSADILASTGEGLSPSEFRFPQDPNKTLGKLFSKSPLEIASDWIKLGLDGMRAIPGYERLLAKYPVSRPKSVKESEITVVVGAGILGWQISDSGARLNPLAKRLMGGPYQPIVDHFESNGIRTVLAVGDNGWQDGRPESYREAEEVVDRELPNCEVLVFFGHSWGGMLGHEYAARHPDKAQKMIIVSGGAPYFPEDMNYFMGRALFAIHGTRHFDRFRFVSEFMSSQEAQKTKFVNFVAKSDPIVTGPQAPGKRYELVSSHSGIFYEPDALDKPIEMAKSELNNRKNRQKFDQMMTKTMPLFISA